MRPEPGLTATCDRVRGAGHDAIGVPLFAVVPVEWHLPPSDTIDALLVTSANAMRHGGAGLAALRALPVVVVGEATATAARAAGFAVAAVGSRDAVAAVALARARGFDRLLHLAGRERVAVPGVDAITVYASDPLPVDAAQVARFVDRVVLLHSSRAARRVAMLVDRDGIDRARIAVAALSVPVAHAAGRGWRAVAVAVRPDDAALIAAAATLG